MKKTIMLAVATMLCAATISYSQKTSTSTSGSSTTSAASGKVPQDGAATGQTKQSGTSGANQAGGENASTGDKQAQKSIVNDGSTRPGGAEHKNANDVGRYSENEDAKSMTHSKEALAERKKNLTESDTTVKKGSGSAPKNMKNKTGKTGNYENQEIKHSQKTQPRP